MPMYQPSGRRRDGGVMYDVGGDGGHVLDLETAVKDGILGGGGGVVCGSGVTEKLDLKKMIEDLDSIDVPSVFICPISLEPMQDPVTICTGQTYERSNIVKWFSMGHFTCPTTMQELWDDSITPNKTLYQLIYSWFSQKYLVMKKRSEDVQGRALEVLETLKKVVSIHASAKKTVADNGGIGLISSLLGPFTSHAVGSEVIGILVNLSLDSESKSNLMQPAKISLMVDMLNEGSIETKINCTKLIEILMEGRDFESEIVPSLSLLVGLLRLVKDKRHQNGILAGLALLKTICLHEPVRNSVVSIGAVPQLVELLPNLNPACLEISPLYPGGSVNSSTGKIGFEGLPKHDTKCSEIIDEGFRELYPVGIGHLISSLQACPRGMCFTCRGSWPCCEAPPRYSEWLQSCIEAKGCRALKIV
uniref:U-box domain-containing protein n=1 Tax=Vitis vinifera TaxID=29760 RepID=A5BNK5_VITVI|nr:hypothetical protein VITISV_035398 [Vitis vinifera]